MPVCNLSDIGHSGFVPNAINKHAGRQLAIQAPLFGKFPFLLVKLSYLFIPELFAIKQGLDGRSAPAYFPLMCSFCIVMLQPDVQIALKLLHRVV